MNVANEEDASVSLSTQDWKHPKFERRGEFFKTLSSRVDGYFKERGISKRDDPRLYIKGAVIMAWLIGSYSLLVFGNLSTPLALLVGVALALATHPLATHPLR